MSLLQKLRRYIVSHPGFRRFFYSFYFRLILLDFKKNHFLLILWLLLFGMVTGEVLPRYGIAYIFLGPEYDNKVNMFSYFITGFACGGFIMAYNMASFIKNAFRFPFLATLKNPFAKYSLNNFFLPLLFVSIYSWQIFEFLRHEELLPGGRIALMLLSFLMGIVVFVFILQGYFIRVGQNITKLYGIVIYEGRKKEPKPDEEEIQHRSRGERNPYLIKESRDWYVETYLVRPFMIRRVRSVRHYKKEMLYDVLKHNQRSAFFFQIVSIVSLIAFGWAPRISLFMLPTSASILLFLTAFLMIFSSFYTWFRGWTTVIFILFLVSVNYLHKVNFLLIENRAYGLDYKGSKAKYDYEALRKMHKDTAILREDLGATLAILERWKQKNTDPANPLKKPKLVMINTSGGGLRSALWTFYALQYTDSLLKGKLLSSTQLITGSSGGMVGAAYLRELYLRHQRNQVPDYYLPRYRNNMAKDILNPIAFSIVTSEWVFPLRSFRVDDQSYPQDRGYIFEQTLNDNLDSIFDKRLSDYYVPETNSQVPMIVFSSSVVNDGRKLLISPLGISYLIQNTNNDSIRFNELFDAVEYTRFFKDQRSERTLYTSVLRMSATFPYIMPVVSLPSEPRIEMIDAGLRDNYGLETSISFIRAFNDWIAENTSGIVIIQTRDKHKNILIADNPSQTMLQTLSRPSGSFYGNLFQVQDFNQNQQLQMLDMWCKTRIEIIDLQLRNEASDHISLSWHLTSREKQKIFSSIDLPENQNAIKRIKELLE